MTNKRWFAYVGDFIQFNPLRLTMKPNRVNYLATWKTYRHFGYDPYNSIDAIQGFWRVTVKALGYDVEVTTETIHIPV